MPEISQQDLAVLQESRRVLDAMYTDPEHGNAVKRAFAKVKPDVVIPELAAETAVKPVMERVDSVAAALEKLNARMDSEAQEREQQRRAEALAAEMAQARDRFRLTDEGVSEMAKLMTERGIVNPMDAAELYASRLPKPPLASRRTGGSATYADVTGMADQAERQQLLLSNPDRFLASEIEACLAEFGLADAA